jgi:prepilin-type N-terminal cleavage/methylation domain-containing protein
MRTLPSKRPGFTLVEMMVTVALTLFIMVILSTAFSTALETFRQLKAIGDMQDELRTAANMLRADLAADHFEGKRRLSDTTFWTVGPPREGFLRIMQSAPGANPLNVDEGLDADNLPSRRRVDHAIHMTVKRRGNRPSDFFSAPIPVNDPQCPLLTVPFPDGRFQDPGSNLFNSQWIEVVWFLAPAYTTSNVQATANGTPLYGLYRQQRVVVPDPSTLNTTNQRTYQQPIPLAVNTNYVYPFSCSLQQGNGPLQQYVYFNSPSALTIPNRRLQMYAPRTDATGFNKTGDDLVMTNVISFDVKVVRSDFPGQMSDLGPNNFFDTWSSIQDELGANYTDPSGIPQNYLISGIQITLRVWDSRTQQTRQITLYQEM